MDYTDLYNFQTTTGMIVPSDGNVLSGIQEKFKEIFGSDMDVSAQTPAGRLVAAIANVVKSALGVNAQSANQFNLNLATGRYLDSLAQVYELTRHAATNTQVPVTVTLTNPNTVVPKGSIIMSDDGDSFEIDADISYDATVEGSTDGQYYYANGFATAINSGPVNGDPGIINKVQNQVLGWIGVTNGPAARIGTDIETDAAFRSRIRDSRPTGTSFLTHLVSRLKRLEGVSAYCVLENNGAVEMAKKGVVVNGHSIYVCVYGSESEDVNKEVAQIISDAKPIGTGMTNDLDPDIGAKLVEIEMFSSEEAVEPTVISFYRPRLTSISVEVEVDARNFVGTNYEDDIKSIVTNYVNGVNIGDTLHATYIVSEIMMQMQTVRVTSVKLSADNAQGVADLETTGYEKLVCYGNNVKVVTLAS